MMAAQNQGKMVPGSIDLSKESMMNRANQIQQLSKRQEERNMNGILKMHDQQIKKGLNALKK